MQPIDVVIPVYGQTALFKKCLETLGTSSAPFNLYVVDDATPNKDDASMIEVIAREHGAKFFRRKTNGGFAKTVNFGVQKGTSPFICLLNSDVMLRPDALEIMLKEFEDPSVGVVGPMLVFPSDSEWGSPGKIQHIGISFNIKGMPFHPFLGWPIDSERAVVRRDFLQAVTGACLMTRRSLWKSVNGMPEAYGRGTFEDIEYCIAVASHGKKIVCNPAANGIHYTGQSIERDQGYPIRENSKIFELRVGAYIRHDEYLIW